MYDYDFCICCCSRDRIVAEELAASLKRFKVPEKVSLPDPELDYRRILPDFEGERFDDEKKEALKRCRRLIMVCTPATRDSRAVLERLLYFEEIRATEAIIPVLAEGEPADAFPPFFIREKRVRHILPDMSVEERTETVEPVAADLRGETPRRQKELLRYETIRIVATLLELAPDMLVRRHEARHRRRTALLAAAVCAILLIVSGLFARYGLAAYHAAVISEKQTAETVAVTDRLFYELPETFADDPQALASVQEAINEAQAALDELGLSGLPSDDGEEGE